MLAKNVQKLPLLSKDGEPLPPEATGLSFPDLFLGCNFIPGSSLLVMNPTWSYTNQDHLQLDPFPAVCTPIDAQLLYGAADISNHRAIDITAVNDSICIDPLWTKYGNISSQPKPADMGAVNMAPAAPIQLLAGDSECSSNSSSDFAAASTTPYSSPIWDAEFSESNLALDANLLGMEAVHPTSNAEVLSASNDAYTVCTQSLGLAENDLCGNMHSDLDTICFSNDAIGEMASDIDWDMYFHDEVPDVNSAASSPLQETSSQEIRPGITDLTESDEDDRPRVDVQNLPAKSKRRRRSRRSPRNTSRSDTRPNATIQAVQLRLGNQVQEFAWQRREGAWKEQSGGMILDLEQLTSPDFRPDMTLKIFVHADGATALLTWEPIEALFVGPDLIIPRTFRVSKQDAWSLLLNPDESRPVDWKQD